MFRYICHYIRDLRGEKPLSVEDIEWIGKDHSVVRVSWGGEYFNFAYDHHNFHPVEGKSNLLVDRVSLRPYSCREILDLIQASHADQLIAYSNEDSFMFTPSSEYIHSELKSINLDFFHAVKIYKYIDYDIMLTDLEEQEFISTRPSQNLIATIDLRGSLLRS
jgi:hypothetical protein